jgi:hypothetical protein
MNFCVSLCHKTRGSVYALYRQGIPEMLTPGMPLCPGPWQVCGFETVNDMLSYLYPVPLRVVRLKTGMVLWITDRLRTSEQGKAGCRPYGNWIGYHWVWDTDDQRLAEEIAIARYQKGVPA